MILQQIIQGKQVLPIAGNAIQYPDIGHKRGISTARIQPCRLRTGAKTALSYARAAKDVGPQTTWQRVVSRFRGKW